MTLEKQVVSLELARKLKELGVRQESAFYWRELSGECKLHKNYSVNVKRREWVYCFAAFTVAELGEMLPIKTASYREAGDHWEMRMSNPSYEAKQFTHDLRTATEADARAKMLCYLIEQKIVEAK